jgi:hypothetical protein
VHIHIYVHLNNKTSIVDLSVDLMDHYRLPTGLIALAKMNGKRRFFLASKENYFAGLQIQEVMIDNGCNTLLIPIRNGQLASFVDRFPNTEYSWEIRDSKGVSHKSIVLCISHLSGAPMQLHLCKDLLSTGSSTPSAPVDFLRFHLCTEDMKSILTTPNLRTMFLPAAIKSVEDYMKSFPATIGRKVHGLLGQELFHNLATIQLSGIIAIFKPAEFKPQGWQEMGHLRSFVNATASLPDKFNDLEDEDHVSGATETDQEDYHSLTTTEFIDECE